LSLPFLSVLSSIKEREKSKSGGEDNDVFGKKFPGKKKRKVRWRVVVMQQPVILSPEFGTESHIFTQSL
jgi:hypothetical protein